MNEDVDEETERKRGLKRKKRRETSKEQEERRQGGDENKLQTWREMNTKILGEKMEAEETKVPLRSNI